MYLTFLQKTTISHDFKYNDSCRISQEKEKFSINAITATAVLVTIFSRTENFT